MTQAAIWITSTGQGCPRGVPWPDRWLSNLAETYQVASVLFDRRGMSSREFRDLGENQMQRLKIILAVAVLSLPFAVPAIAAAADCQGCYAGWAMWRNGNRVYEQRSTYANETVDFIHVHGSLVKREGSPPICRADNLQGTNSGFNVDEARNTSARQRIVTSLSYSSSNFYINTGAHEWRDDGQTWHVGRNGETDYCRYF
jgi:hypothetical protein